MFTTGDATIVPAPSKSTPRTVPVERLEALIGRWNDPAEGMEVVGDCIQDLEEIIKEYK